MTEKNPPAVQEAIDEAYRTREKYNHPQPDTHERDKDEPDLGFVRWVQKGGHIDPAAKEQHPEYLELFEKLGGDDSGVTLKDGTRVERTRAGEVPPANREHPTDQPENAEIAQGAKVIVDDGKYRDAQDEDHKPAGKQSKDSAGEGGDKVDAKATEKPQGLLKTQAPKNRTTSTKTN